MRSSSAVSCSLTQSADCLWDCPLCFRISLFARLWSLSVAWLISSRSLSLSSALCFLKMLLTFLDAFFLSRDRGWFAILFPQIVFEFGVFHSLSQFWSPVQFLVCLFSYHLLWGGNSDCIYFLDYYHGISWGQEICVCCRKEVFYSFLEQHHIHFFSDENSPFWSVMTLFCEFGAHFQSHREWSMVRRVQAIIILD